jgi:hypothetical protein
MHRQNPLFHHSVAYKKGFALILTLSALTVIIALTAVLISYLDEARKDASTSKAIIQGNLYYADIKKIFKGFKKKKTLYSVLYLSPIPLISDNGRFSVIVDCKPMASGVNINWLAFAYDEKMSLQYNAVQKVFESIVQTYDLEDASRLEEMLLEEIGGKNKVFVREQSRLRQKNGIISLRQFTDILDRYQRESDDSNIGQVPWEKFFVFTEISKDPEENLIDGNYLSAELISVLFDIDYETVKEEWITGSVDLKTFIQNLGGTINQKLYVKEFLDQSQCEIQYDYEGERFAFSFEDREGEVKHFEFFGKQ